VAEPIAIKHRALLSYAHADTASAKWLHKALEGFRIDKDLAGRETPIGPVSKTLRPIFRAHRAAGTSARRSGPALCALPVSEHPKSCAPSSPPAPDCQRDRLLKARPRNLSASVAHKGFLTSSLALKLSCTGGSNPYIVK
jgi:hypothetical protein